MSVFFISDPHFYHENIIAYENRPFADVNEMNKSIIKNWNNVVNRKDTVFCMGDVSFGNKEETLSTVPQLNGKKILIMGNHDRQRKPKFWREAGFDEVIKYPIVYANFYILSHEPIYLNEHTPYVNIHGHIHHVCMDFKQYVNVSVECINYTPIKFEQIQSLLSQR